MCHVRVFPRGGGSMFFPKVISFTLLLLSKTNLVYPSDINKNPLNKTELLNLNNKEKTDCTKTCYRPASNNDTCEKYGTESIGCLNYKRCFEKCEENEKSKNKNLN